MDNNAITKRNGNIAFQEETHQYWDITDPSKHFTSVTTIIEKFGQPFPKEFWSAYKALEKLLPKDAWAIEKKSLLQSKKFDKSLLTLHDIDENDFNREQQAILDSWEAENKKSCERGTKIHADLEHSFYKKKKNIDLAKYQIGGTFECRKDYTDLDLENAIYPEYLIHRVSPDGKLCIAGQIDLLVKQGNHITIGDWKGLPLDTFIPTASGIGTLMKFVQVGDILLDKDGNLTKVLHKSEVHHNPCYKITFDTGDSIVADYEHRWWVNNSEVKTTEELTINDKIYLHSPNKELMGSKLRTLVTTLLTLHIDPIITLHFNSFSSHHYEGHEAERNLILRELSLLGIKIWINEEENTLSFYREDLKNRWNIKPVNEERAYKNIVKIEPTKTVPTQCIEVDSPTHTFLCGNNITVTHNTNKKIDTKGFFDSKTKSTVKMKYPLNKLDDINYNHYCLQLSTYAWMLQKLNPDFIIDDLVLVHFDHQDNMTVYHLPYLKEEVEKMLAFFKKETQLEENARKRQKIEY